MKYVALTCVLVTLAIGVAFQPEHAGTWYFWAPLVLVYGALSLVALFRMQQVGSLAEKLMPRRGDVALGAVIAGLLILGTWIGRSTLAPVGTPSHGWLLRLYLQVGNPETLQRSVKYTALLLLIPICEELVWRGLVLGELKHALGPRKAWPLGALLYALCHIPTVFSLSDPVAGPNPLVLLAAVGAGLVWTFSANQFGRLAPVIISHMAFTYFSAAQFRMPF